MMAYDRVVTELNAARLRGVSFPIVHSFTDVANSLNDVCLILLSVS